MYGCRTAPSLTTSCCWITLRQQPAPVLPRSCGICLAFCLNTSSGSVVTLSIFCNIHSMVLTILPSQNIFGLWTMLLPYPSLDPSLLVPALVPACGSWHLRSPLSSSCQPRPLRLSANVVGAPQQHAFAIQAYLVVPCPACSIANLRRIIQLLCASVACTAVLPHMSGRFVLCA